MKRYQKLILAEVDKIGYTPLARIIGAPSTSVHEWATQPYKTPHYKSLEKLAAHFNIPLPALLMEVDELKKNLDDEILEALLKMTLEQKEKVVDYINRITK